METSLAFCWGSCKLSPFPHTHHIQAFPFWSNAICTYFWKHKAESLRYLYNPTMWKNYRKCTMWNPLLYHTPGFIQPCLMKQKALLVWGRPKGRDSCSGIKDFVSRAESQGEEGGYMWAPRKGVSVQKPIACFLCKIGWKGTDRSVWENC